MITSKGTFIVRTLYKVLIMDNLGVLYKNFEHFM